ncbi:MAG: nucleoside phosphorylase [Deltaproteobacteria bacterium]|nr:nucleoside phosphorylase [Deltaproteobacteria bacterium]
MAGQTIPLTFGRPSDAAFFNPTDWVTYAKSLGKFKKWEPIECCILTFNYDWFKLLKKTLSLHSKQDRHIHIFKVGTKKIAGHFVSVGGSKSGVELEILTALGVKKFVAIGSAGSLQKHIVTGDICLPTQAIRDEGTSYHYQDPSKYSYPNASLLHKLEKILQRKNFPYFSGPTWTTDAPYRETIRKIKTYREEGCLTVEMEAASLFAIAKFRKVPVISILGISDELTSTHWQPLFHHEKHHQAKEKLIDAALETLMTP